MATFSLQFPDVLPDSRGHYLQGNPEPLRRGLAHLVLCGSLQTMNSRNHLKVDVVTLIVHRTNLEPREVEIHV